MRRYNKILLLLVACVMTFVQSCKIDNYDGPNASFSGIMKDSKTGNKVGTDIENGSEIRAFELGFPTPTAQIWRIKNTGEFTNSMVFSASYDFEFVNCNFYPFTVKDFKIKPGTNTHDFEVTPYIRILNAQIKHDATGKKIIATFNLEGGKPEVLLKELRLFAFSDIWVGNNVKFALTGSDQFKVFSPEIAIDGGQYSLSIDLDQNKGIFKYNKNYYFRIGALAAVSNVGTVRYNYSEVVSIPLQ